MFRRIYTQEGDSLPVTTRTMREAAQNYLAADPSVVLYYFCHERREWIRHTQTEQFEFVRHLVLMPDAVFDAIERDLEKIAI